MPPTRNLNLLFAWSAREFRPFDEKKRRFISGSRQPVMDDKFLVGRDDVDMACRLFAFYKTLFGHNRMMSICHVPEILPAQDVNFSFAFRANSQLHNPFCLN